jgi:flagellar biosynthesis/type III secretory pathway M-ring protein FliF/YscJ
MSDGSTLSIGPGVWGFLALFVLAIALWLLVRNMNARLRRMAYREHERVEAERAAAAETAEQTGTTDKAPDQRDVTDEGPENTERG